MTKDPEVAAVLTEIGLAHLADRFAREDIDISVLQALDDSDLRDLGLTLGQRRNLLDRLNSRGGVEIPAASASVPEPELRRVSVLFSNLVEFTILLSQIDPDEVSCSNITMPRNALRSSSADLSRRCKATV